MIRSALFAAATAVLCFGQREATPPSGASWRDRLLIPYEPAHFAPVSFGNSPRIDSLLRAGKLYLSLDDAIALALENNLDIELQRYAPAIAQSDLERARGGASSLRGIPFGINLPPPGIGGPEAPIVNSAASGVTPATTVPNSLVELSAIVPSQTSASIIPGPFSSGPAVPIFDPAIVGSLNWQRMNTPQTNTITTGAGGVSSRDLAGSLGLEKGFGLGTQLGVTLNSSAQTANSPRNLYNPFNSSNLGLSLTQPLLRGFGFSVNRRFIRIAKNNQRISDLVFRQQVIETVAGVIRLYFDLVSLMDDVRVKQETLALAQRLYSDNQLKVDQGTLAPIELVRAQAQVAASRQDLANSEGLELQQELIVKTVLTRRGVADPLLREARIVATTPIEIPAREEVRPVQDMVDEAYGNRPELEEGRIQISNSRITLQGSRNALLPELNIVASAQNSGLAGQPNPLAQTTSGSGLTTTPDQSSVGGAGAALGQVFRGSYPTYGIGIQLNLPLRNRIAQGDYARDEITVRQTEIRQQQLQNQVRLEVEGAVIAVQRARAAYDAAVEARRLQEQSLSIELEKYANGVSTNFLVMQYQSYLAQARSTEVVAKSVYVKAKSALERATGETLANHNIAIEDVYRGRISAAPSPLPPP